MKFNKIQDLVITSIFIALMIVLALTPVGIIRLPFLAINATILHVPVILGSLLLGPKKGAVLGFTFGLISFLINTITPTTMSFVFSPFVPVPPALTHGSAWALVVVFVPRILVGIVPYYIFVGLGKVLKNNYVNAFAAGIAGALVNTLLVLHFMYTLFHDAWRSVGGTTASQLYAALLGVIASNGLAEAILGGLIVAIITPRLLIVLSKNQTSEEDLNDASAT